MEIFKESTVQKEKFRSAANKLLNQCFIVKKKEDTRSEYIFILEYKAKFEEYFDLLGYELKINETSGVIALLNYNGTGRLRLKKIESILLLIFRLLYIEKKKEIGLIDDVLVLTNQVHEKYKLLQIEGKPHIDKTAFREAIRLFKRYNILTNMDTDVTQDDARIIIFPSILFAVPVENIDTMHTAIQDKLGTYFDGGENSDDEEIDED